MASGGSGNKGGQKSFKGFKGQRYITPAQRNFIRGR